MASSKVKAGRLRAAMEVFRELDPEMPAQQISIFLCVAEEDGISMRDIETKVDMSASSVSRSISALSDTHRKGAAGHNLIRATPNPEDRRYHLCTLTPKGRKVLELLDTALST